MSIEELIQRAREKDSAAFRELFRRSEPTIRKQTRKMMRSQPPVAGARPSDLAHDTFERVLHAFADFKGKTQGEWYSYLHTILGNHLSGTIRYAGRQKRDSSGDVPLNEEETAEIPSNDTSVSQNVMLQEEARRLYACIYQLPRDQGEAFVLRELKELPFSEVARLMGGRTVNSVMGLRDRAWSKLIARMNGHASGKEELPRETVEAFMDYLRLRDKGPSVDAEAFIARHPGCASKLSDMIHWVERLKLHKPTLPKK